MDRVVKQDRVFLFARAVARGEDIEEIRAHVSYFSTTTQPLSALTWGLSHDRLADCSPLHVAALTDNVKLGEYVIELLSESGNAKQPQQAGRSLSLIHI